MSVAEALGRLLAGSGWRARAVDAGAFRIEREPPPLPRAHPPQRPLPMPKEAPAVPSPVQEIVVTGQKRRQPLNEVAMAVSVVPLGRSAAGGVALGSRELAESVDGLALTNLGPGRNRQFIRGIADSAFNGPSQGTVAIQIDEARVTFDAPDPDLRLVDMERVEVLKGPQGALYGSGALGGIYHIVTRKPDLTVASGSARAIGEAIDHGGVGAGGEVALNLPLKTDTLALRGVAYALRAGGWIDNVGSNRNANRTVTDGGRLALRWQPTSRWTLDVTGVLQNINSRDSQYVTASDDTRRRVARIAEPSDNDFKSVAATAQGDVGALKLLAATSYIAQDVRYTLDSSDASALFGLSGASRFDSDSRYTIVNHELRLSPAASGRWLAGISYLHAHSHTDAEIQSAAEVLPVEGLDRYVTELAVFGEAKLAVAGRLTATVGARLARSIAENEAAERSGGTLERISKTILSPSVALAWAPGQRSVVYLRYARALRPGGIAPASQSGTNRFDSDDLGTLDLGMRFRPAGGPFSASASLFYTNWNHIQSDYLLANGLISTRNAGRGRILGAEASVDWEIARGLRVSAGGSYIDAVLISTENGLKVEDRRLPVVPDLTARLAVHYGFALASGQATVSAHANYVGHARLTFDEALDREMGNYLPLSAAALYQRGRFSLGARIDNLLDIQGDSFAFGNQFSILTSQQYTPLRPRTFTLSIARSW